MIKNLNSISIKNKVIFGLFFTLFVSMGIGISQFNKIIMIQHNYHSKQVLNTYKKHFRHIQNNYYALEANVVNLSATNLNEKYIVETNKFKVINNSILDEFDDLSNISVEHLESDSVIMFIGAFHDSLFRYQDIYKRNISSPIDEIIRYKYLIFHPEKIKAQQEMLVAEQQKIGTISSDYESEKFNNDEAVEELLNVYHQHIVSVNSYTNSTLMAEIKSIDYIANRIERYIEKDEEQIANIRTSVIRTSGLFFILSILLIIVLSVLMSKNVINPLLKTNDIIGKISKGNYNDKIDLSREDELGLILESVSLLVENLKETSNFAQSISNGNYDYNFIPAGDGDLLGNSLIQLRDSLLQVEDEEKSRKKDDFRRSREAEGLAKFSNILRLNQNNLKKLGNEVISNLVKYLGANQGVIFLLNDNDAEEVYLELLAAYAWNREKFIHKKLKIGEGLIGAVAEEKFTVYMTDVPEDYIEIKSGTGAANPSSIIIVPLKVDDEVLGVIELASFKNFDKYEIELVEKIAESIASTLKSVRISEQTADLLQKFQLQAVEMKEQENAMKTSIDKLKKTNKDKSITEDKLRTKVRELEDLNKKNKYREDQIKLDIVKLEKQNQEMLTKYKTGRQHARYILQKVTSAALIISTDNKVNFVNKVAEMLWEYQQNDMLNLDLNQIIQMPEDVNEIDVATYLFKNREQIVENQGVDMFIKLKGGRLKSVHVDVMEVDAEEGEQKNMILFINDAYMMANKNKINDTYTKNVIKYSFDNIKKIEKYEELLSENYIDVTKIKFDTNKLINWKPAYEMDIAIIDNQHKRWSELINSYYKGIVEDVETEALKDAFKKFITYSEFHFGFKYKYMVEFNFEERDIHKSEQEKFIKQMNDLFDNYIDTKDIIIGYTIVTILKTWTMNYFTNLTPKYVSLFKKHGLK